MITMRGETMRYVTYAIVALLALVMMPATAFGQQAYEIGVSGALTGPAASTIAPAIQGLRLYVNRLNKEGGVHGHPIHLIIRDDGGQASNAAANAKQLLSDDHVALLINASLSSTYAPMMKMADRTRTPLLFAANAVCPSQAFPPAQRFVFCSSGISTKYDGRAAIAFIHDHASGPVRLGLVAMAIPVSRGGINHAAGAATKMGMKIVQKEAIPPTTASYTSFATNIQDGKANWAYSWAPWVTEVKTFEALRQLGWNGSYAAVEQPVAENELKHLKDSKFYIVSSDSLFSEKLPIQKKMMRVATSANAKYPADEMTEGWIAGMVLKATLAKAGWPATRQKVLASMDTLKVAMHGLRGGPILWTKRNHFRTRQYYRVYHWNPSSGSIVRAQDWKAFVVK